MEEYFIDSTRMPDTEAPMAFINAICTGEGGVIRIASKAYAPKVLWALKSILSSIGVGYQLATINKLTSQGMHQEHAEHYVTAMINTLIGAEVPPLPSDAQIKGIIEKYKKKQDGKD